MLSDFAADRTAQLRPPFANRPLHVLTLTPFYPTERDDARGCFVAEPLSELAKLGVQSTVFAVEAFYRPRAQKSSWAPDARWYRYPSLPGGTGLASAGAGLYLRLRGAVGRLHARSPIDLIHAHGALPCGHAAFLLGRLLRIPFVVTVHGLDAFSLRQVTGRPGKWSAEVSQRVYTAARRVIGVSQHVCDEVQKRNGGQALVSVVYNGADPAKFTPAGDPPEPVILSVGNLIPSKGHELMVHALAALCPEFSTLTWEVIGEGMELNRIRALAKRLGVLSNVRFRGRQNRAAVAEACRACTVFALPSGYEGLGCVYLEAMASGKVAVGCLGQGIDEVIRHGENGWLVPPGGREELVDGLGTVLRDKILRGCIGNAARQAILQSYTLAHQAQRLLAIYRECIG